MKILIFYASFGNGHKSAAFAIKDYLEENYENDVEIEIIDAYKYINTALNATTAKSYELITAKTPVIWEKIYTHADEKGVITTFLKELNKIAAFKLAKLINTVNPDVIISTHMFSNNICNNLKKKNKINCKTFCVLTDFALHSEWIQGNEYTDYFFVSNNAIKIDCIKRGVDENKIFVTGIPISPKFNKEYNKSIIRKEFELKNMPTILFFAASSYAFDSMQKVFENLIQIDNVQIITVCGKKEKTKEIFEEIQNNIPHNSIVKLLSFTNKVPELMYFADYIVTKPGGITTSEALASCKPIIICNPIPGQEEQNSNFLLNNGVAIRLFENDDMYITLKNFFNSPIRIKEIKRMEKEIGKPNSTKDICEFVINNFKK